MLGIEPRACLLYQRATHPSLWHFKLTTYGILRTSVAVYKSYVTTNAVLKDLFVFMCMCMCSTAHTFFVPSWVRRGWRIPWD